MLETIWFLLWGVLWAIYFVLDGFDLGLGTLSPFLAKTEQQRRTIHSAIGPFWDGNEVWLITAGGVTFAAFPTTYAVMFSALYTPLMMLLFALILRAVSLEFRDKVESPSWKRLWDLFFFLGSLVPALLLGVAFANLFRGIPIDREGVYQGTLFTLLHPYGLLGGVLFVALFAQHGAIWLALRSQGEMLERATAAARALWLLVLVVAAIFLGYSSIETTLYTNYLRLPPLFLIPALAVAGLFLVRLQLAKGAHWKAWGFSALTIAAATMFGVVGMYPQMIPSSLDPSFSLTAQNAASSPLTLTIMLVVALVFVPMVLIYQGWVYKVFSTRIPAEGPPVEESY